MKRVETSEELAEATGTKSAVVLFHASWCPFCRAFLPVFQEAVKGSKLEVVEAVVDDEENPLWTEHAIELVPTVIFFDQGKPGRRLDGRMGVGLTREDIVGALAKA
jgi:thioredoxin 1